MRNTTCAAPGWSVSATVSGDTRAARLSVGRVRGYAAGARGDLDGRVFTSSDAAFARAEAHGYCIRYFSPGADWRAIHRAWSREAGARVRRAVLAAKGRAELVELGDQLRQEALALGCDLLNASRYALAATSAAYRLRPDLRPAPFSFAA